MHKDPVSAVPRPVLDDKPPGILTVEQAAELMKACQKLDPGMCGFFALALFAGIRPSQLLRMTPENVTLDERVVRAVGWQTKSRQNRLVDLSENCVAWCKVGMELPPTNWRKRFDKVRLVAGIDEWPPDCMRHSFASYHLGANGSADKTAAQMGHRSTEMIFQHYRELVPKKEAEKFWQIMPEAPDKTPVAPGKTRTKEPTAPVRKSTRSPLSARGQSALPGKSVPCT
jgi:integrase